MVLQPYPALFFPTFLKTLTQVLLTPGQVLFSYSQKGRFVPMCHHTINNSRPPAPQLNELVLNCSDSVKLTFLPHHTQYLLCTPNKVAHYHKTTRHILVKPTLVHNTAHYTGCAKKTHPEAPVVLAPCHTVKQTWVSLTKSLNGKKKGRKKTGGSFLLQYQLTLEISSGNWQRANNFDLAPCWQKMHHCGKALQSEPGELDMSIR